MEDTRPARYLGAHTSLIGDEHGAAGQGILTSSCLCMQWFSTYSRLLSDYMRRDKGIGMDLTLVRC